jgi:hypothetical protein
MPFMRNIDSGAVIGPIANDSATYLALQKSKSANFPLDPLYEDVSSPQAAAVGVPYVYTVQQELDTPGAKGVSLVSTILVVPIDGDITKVEYYPAAGVTGANSPDSRTLSLIKGAATEVASLPLVDSTDLVANASNEIPITGDEADADVVKGDILKWSSAAVTGAGGVVDPGGLVVVTITAD